MSRQLLMSSFGVLLAIVMLAPRSSADGHALQGDARNAPNEPSVYNTLCAEALFQGDLRPEIGIGCSNDAGTSGGPNDAAVGVTAALTPPFVITSHFYNLFDQPSPTITALTFAVWAGGPSPGGTVATQPGLTFTPGSHTVAITPGITVLSSQFYFGQIQPQTNAGTRWGLDTSSGSAGTSFIRAPSCGVATFFTVDSLGFPGNWVMSACLDTSVPVELTSWGNVKAAYRRP